MLNFAWDLFSRTGSIETYLLIKEIEEEKVDGQHDSNDGLGDIDFPMN